MLGGGCWGWLPGKKRKKEAAQALSSAAHCDGMRMELGPSTAEGCLHSGGGVAALGLERRECLGAAGRKGQKGQSNRPCSLPNCATTTGHHPSKRAQTVHYLQQCSPALLPPLYRLIHHERPEATELRLLAPGAMLDPAQALEVAAQRCARVCMCLHACACVCMNARCALIVRVCVYACVCAHVRVCICACVHVCVLVVLCLFACTCACKCVRVTVWRKGWAGPGMGPGCGTPSIADVSVLDSPLPPCRLLRRAVHAQKQFSDAQAALPLGSHFAGFVAFVCKVLELTLTGPRCAGNEQGRKQEGSLCTHTHGYPKIGQEVLLRSWVWVALL